MSEIRATDNNIYIAINCVVRNVCVFMEEGGNSRMEGMLMVAGGTGIVELSNQHNKTIILK